MRSLERHRKSWIRRTRLLGGALTTSALVVLGSIAAGYGLRMALHKPMMFSLEPLCIVAVCLGLGLLGVWLQVVGARRQAKAEMEEREQAVR